MDDVEDADLCLAGNASEEETAQFKVREQKHAFLLAPLDPLFVLSPPTYACPTPTFAPSPPYTPTIPPFQPLSFPFPSLRPSPTYASPLISRGRAKTPHTLPS